MIVRALIVIASMALTGCVPASATPEQDRANAAAAAANEVNAAAAAAREAADAVLADEFRDVAQTCHLPEARLARDGDHYNLLLPTALYRVRDRDPVHGRMLCITHWGLEIGEDFEIVEAR